MKHALAVSAFALGLYVIIPFGSVDITMALPKWIPVATAYQLITLKIVDVSFVGRNRKGPFKVRLDAQTAIDGDRWIQHGSFAPPGTTSIQLDFILSNKSPDVLTGYVEATLQGGLLGGIISSSLPSPGGVLFGNINFKPVKNYGDYLLIVTYREKGSAGIDIIKAHDFIKYLVV